MLQEVHLYLVYLGREKVRNRKYGKAQWKKGANKRRHYERNKSKYPHESTKEAPFSKQGDLFWALMARFRKKWMAGEDS